MGSNLLRAVPFFMMAAAPDVSVFTLQRTLDRTFTDTPASGGGNAEPDTFMYKGQQWEVWQVVPFLGSGVAPVTRGDIRLHLRNRAISRSAMQLADMPAMIEVSNAAWTGSPWVGSRPASASKFTNVGSGNSARRSIDYEPTRSPLVSPSASGVAQGQTFTLKITF